MSYLSFSRSLARQMVAWVTKRVHGSQFLVRESLERGRTASSGYPNRRCFFRVPVVGMPLYRFVAQLRKGSTQDPVCQSSLMVKLCVNTGLEAIRFVHGHAIPCNVSKGRPLFEAPPAEVRFKKATLFPTSS